MEELRVELEACRKKLEAKYKAVNILQQQAELADAELKSTEKKAEENNQRLCQELSKLQFELEYKESSFLDSQQTWAERFDRWDSFHSFHLLLIPDFLHKPLWFYFLFSLIIWAMQTFDNIYDHIIHFYNNVFLWFWTVMFDLTFLELWALGINFIN